MIRSLSLSFRQRILAVLVLAGAVPTALAVLGWAVSLRQVSPSPAARGAIVEVAASGRDLLSEMDTLRLPGRARRALDRHAASLNAALGRLQRAEAYGEYYSGGLALMVLVLGGVLVYTSVRLGGHLSRQLSRPIDELVGWTGNIRRQEPLPPDRPRGGAPEFAALRTALRGMAAALEAVRQRDREAERLRAFREVARRVAHEMKNPLTPIRFAVAQLERTALPAQREALDVLLAESRRLEEMAREFAELGRLPEGPPAEVDLRELLEELVRTAVPPEVQASVAAAPELPMVVGHYDPLRRAFANLLRNAVQAMGGAGRLEVTLRPAPGGGVSVAVADHGPGVPPALRDTLFEPYVTSKPDGTGLGLAIVRQVVEQHGGTVACGDTPGGGATFSVTLGAAPAAPTGS